MTARPIACGRFRDDGTLELWRGNRLSTVLLSSAAINEALEDGWVLSNGWRDELHQIVLLSQVHDISRIMFERAVVATAAEDARLAARRDRGHQ
jgi:hypothetical protein